MQILRAVERPLIFNNVVRLLAALQPSREPRQLPPKKKNERAS